MKKIFPVLLLALSAACTQEALTPAGQALAQTGPVTVEAVFTETVAEARGEGAAETRTTLEGLSPVWMDVENNNGPQCAVFLKLYNFFNLLHDTGSHAILAF